MTAICHRCKNTHTEPGAHCGYCQQVSDLMPSNRPDRNQSSNETAALDAYTEQLRDRVEIENSGGWIE